MMTFSKDDNHDDIKAQAYGDGKDEVQRKAPDLEMRHNRDTTFATHSSIGTTDCATLSHHNHHCHLQEK